MEDKVWTTEEVIQLLIKERETAVKIAYKFYDKYTLEYNSIKDSRG